jgi:methyl-accepting chemotaxis protein
MLGGDASREVAAALQQIAGNAERVTNLVNDVAIASREQAQGITQVNAAVTDMDRVTQSTAAGAEESASASEELNAQSQELRAMVEQMVAMVGGATQRAATPTAARPAPTPPPRLVRPSVSRTLTPAHGNGHAKAVEQLIPLSADELADF